MKKSLFQNLTVNTIQLIINQLFSLVIFYILSTGLSKNSFGQIGLALAVLLAAFNILSFGIDQLSIKKIAGEVDAQSILSLYICHVLITGLAFFGLLIIGAELFPKPHFLYTLVSLLAIGKLMLFFSSPFKQAANGLERFRLLAYMSVISNFIRCCGLIILVVLHQLLVYNIVLVFIAGDVTELLLCIYLFRRFTKIPVIIKWHRADYRSLLVESLPQTGVVLITSALARFDWLFIGFMVSAVKLAEYSFAYKIFEMATLPLLAIAPLLIPRFTRLFQAQDIRPADLKLLVRIEMIVAVFIGLLLNICWSPVIDALTGGKYGLINANTIFILSLCMPVLYLNNFLWTVYFAQGRLKTILRSFILAFTVNVAADILLIPFFKNEGAAIAFLAACVVQTVYYINQNNISAFNNVFYPLIICVGCALFSGFFTKIIFTDIKIALPLAVAIYFILLFITGQVKVGDHKKIMLLLGW